jgi:hypothetical protein
MNIQQKSVRRTRVAFGAMALVAAGIAQGQVPADIAAKLKEIGRGVCPAETAALYRPLQPTAPYPGVKVERDVSFGPDPRNVVDIFSPEKGGGKRPVLIYVAGGAGNKIEQIPNGEAFYDNIMLWAVKNGMTGVNLQRRGGGGMAWDDPAKDIGLGIEWVRKNISKYKGNPDRVFIWAHSAGNPPVGTYIGHPELYGPDGIGLKGAILMGPAAFSLLPVTVPPPAPQAGGGGGGGFGACGGAAAAGGRGAGGGGGRGPGGPGGAAAKGGPPPDGKGGGDGKGRGGRGAPVDPATQLARSDLPGILSAKIAFFLGSGELDPPAMGAFVDTLKEQLCKAGHCPTVMLFKDHSHMSEVFSPNTADVSVTGPILKWMKSVK